MNNQYEDFKVLIQDVLGLDLNAYKEQQMRRRINQWLERYKFSGYIQLIDEIKRNPEHRQSFTKYLTINTSHFFRDKGVFQAIDDIVIPDITKNRSRPRIWSAGCSTGAEIYSIAILLAERGITARELWATDIDREVLEKARSGIYSPNEIGNLTPALLQKYFKLLNGKYHIAENFRNMVTFRHHNLLQDRPLRVFDLILCRNVFIYFTNETQKKLLHGFVSALHPGGYFIVGSAEHIMDPDSFDLTRVSYCIYKKRCKGG